MDLFKRVKKLEEIKDNDIDLDEMTFSLVGDPNADPLIDQEPKLIQFEMKVAPEMAEYIKKNIRKHRR